MLIFDITTLAEITKRPFKRYQQFYIRVTIFFLVVTLHLMASICNPFISRFQLSLLFTLTILKSLRQVLYPFNAFCRITRVLFSLLPRSLRCTARSTGSLASHRLRITSPSPGFHLSMSRKNTTRPWLISTLHLDFW